MFLIPAKDVGGAAPGVKPQCTEPFSFGRSNKLTGLTNNPNDFRGYPANGDVCSHCLGEQANVNTFFQGPFRTVSGAAGSGTRYSNGTGRTTWWPFGEKRNFQNPLGLRQW
jgi:hypothetical protein